MSNIQVKMLVTTSFKGARLHTGDEIGVTPEVAERWAKRGIATPISQDFSKLTAKQLYVLCVERGIETEPKLSKDAYLELLSGGI